MKIPRDQVLNYTFLRDLELYLLCELSAVKILFYMCYRLFGHGNIQIYIFLLRKHLKKHKAFLILSWNCYEDVKSSYILARNIPR